MPLVVNFNPRQLEANVQQIGERAVKGMHLVAKRRAIKIRDLAREYAPVRTGLLEKNIEWASYKDSARRNTYVVYIDIDAIRRSGSGSLGDYAFLMEEELRPYGAGKYRLGAASRAKAAGGKKVGGRFLRRAVQEGSKAFMDDMVVAVRRVTGDTRIVTMDYKRAGAESSEE